MKSLLISLMAFLCALGYMQPRQVRVLKRIRM